MQISAHVSLQSPKQISELATSPSAIKLSGLILLKQYREVEQLCASCEAQVIIDLLSSMQSNGSYAEVVHLEPWLAKKYSKNPLVLYNLARLFESSKNLAFAKKYFNAALAELNKSKSGDSGITKLKELISSKIKSLD